MGITYHDITIQNLNNLDIGVCVVNLNKPVDESSVIDIVESPNYISIVPIFGNNKTIKLIWKSDFISESYNVRFSIKPV